MGCKYAVINRQTHVGKQCYRHRGCRSITSWIDGTSPSSCTARRTAEWSIEQHCRHVRCNELWEQARMATKHEQSETHNENDDRRDSATRRYQGPQTVRNVRLFIASINVTSAVSGSGAAREHTYETGGLNMTGRMAELDYLFSDADLDIIGVQESRFAANADFVDEWIHSLQLWSDAWQASLRCASVGQETSRKSREMHRSCQSKTAYC